MAQANLREISEPERSERRPGGDPAPGAPGAPGPSKRRLDRIAYAVAFAGIPLVWFLVSCFRKGSVPLDGDCIGAFTGGRLGLVGPAFSWAVVGELSLAVYVYSAAVRRKDFRAVFLGLAVWVGEIAWEMLNGSIRHWHCYPLFGYQGQTSWGMYPGLTVEISLMFAIAPLVLFNMLPKNKHARIFGLPSRLVVPFGLGVFCAFVEVLLNRAGALTWTWWFWRWPHLGPVLFVYSAPFLVMTLVYDAVGGIEDEKWRKRASPLAFAGLTVLAVICHFTLPHGEDPVASCPATANPKLAMQPLERCSTDGHPR